MIQSIMAIYWGNHRKIPTFYWDFYEQLWHGNTNVFNPFLSGYIWGNSLHEWTNKLQSCDWETQVVTLWLPIDREKWNTQIAPNSFSSPLDVEPSSWIVMIPMFSHIQVNLYA